MLQLISTSKNLVLTNVGVNDNLPGVSLNYNKSLLQKGDGVVDINIDRAVSGKGEFSNVRTYTQNSVKKYELSGNKEMCIRKIMIATRIDNWFDVTVREIKIYYRKNKKQSFNKVIRFKTAIGSIEHVFDLLKNQTYKNSDAVSNQYLLN